MFNLRDAKVSLAECHITEATVIYKTLREVNDPKYFSHRANEALKEIDLGIKVEDNLKLAIQLLNIRRVLEKQAAEAEIQSALEELAVVPELGVKYDVVTEIEARHPETDGSHEHVFMDGVCTTCFLTPEEIAEELRKDI